MIEAGTMQSTLGSRLKRRIRWLAGRDWFPAVGLRVETLRMGSASAGWTVAPDLLGPDSIVWCVGIGEDISFDLALHDRFGMKIDAFDPTPRSLEWVRSQPLPPGYRVHPYGLADRDGIVLFKPPDNPDHVSHSIVDDPPKSAIGLIPLEVRRLGTLAEALGQSRIDLLKIDIEGAEYAVIDDLRGSGCLPSQLLVEFHHRKPGLGIEHTRRAVQTVRDLGYELFHVSPNGEDYAFLHSAARRARAN